MYVYTYTHIHTYTHTHIHTYTHTYTGDACRADARYSQFVFRSALDLRLHRYTSHICHMAMSYVPYFTQDCPCTSYYVPYMAYVLYMLHMAARDSKSVFGSAM
jgi:hypothetical protein